MYLVTVVTDFCYAYNFPLHLCFIPPSLPPPSLLPFYTLFIPPFLPPSLLRSLHPSVPPSLPPSFPSSLHPSVPPSVPLSLPPSLCPSLPPSSFPPSLLPPSSPPTLFSQSLVHDHPVSALRACLQHRERLLNFLCYKVWREDGNLIVDKDRCYTIILPRNSPSPSVIVLHSQGSFYLVQGDLNSVQFPWLCRLQTYISS